MAGAPARLAGRIDDDEHIPDQYPCLGSRPRSLSNREPSRFFSHLAGFIRELIVIGTNEGLVAARE
ncbi:hypothetical protein ACFWWA_17250 [Streptomyces goshikiensis]|uniref:hypothetical protein n=1 Tax=Streptomyces goshikiensis TaxID=1942 RepID=UPI00365DAC72